MSKRFLNTNLVFVIVGALVLLYLMTSSQTMQYGGADEEERTFLYNIKDKKDNTLVQKGEFTFAPREIGGTEGDAALARAIKTFTFAINDINNTNMGDFVGKISSTTGSIKGTILVKCVTPQIAAMSANVVGVRINYSTQMIDFEVSDVQFLAGDCGSNKVSIVLKLSSVSTPTHVVATSTLSTGAIAGIAIGSVVCFLACLLMFALEARQSSYTSIPRQRATFY